MPPGYPCRPGEINVSVLDILLILKVVPQYLRCRFDFCCGLLSSKANRVMFILFKYQTTTPIPVTHISMMDQFRYSEVSLFNHLGWIEFTKKFLSLSEFLFETNSNSITESVPHCLHFPFCLRNSLKFVY